MITTPLSSYASVITVFGLLLSGCMPISADAMRAEADRMDANATAAQRQVIDATAGAAQQQAQGTQAAAQATVVESTAVFQRATAASAQATTIAVQGQATAYSASISATAGWFNGQLTSVPTYLAATATRQAVLAQKADRMRDAGAWIVFTIVALLALIAVMVMGYDWRESRTHELRQLRAAAALRNAIAAENVVSVAEMPVTQWQTGGTNGNAGNSTVAE